MTIDRKLINFVLFTEEDLIFNWNLVEILYMMIGFFSIGLLLVSIYAGIGLIFILFSSILFLLGYLQLMWLLTVYYLEIIDKIGKDDK
jgi:hypothetical protein